MKKINKRILALILAMTMILSSSLVVAAAEPNSKDTTINIVATSGADQYVGPTSDDGIMPLTDYIINQNGSNMSNGSTFYDEFTLARDERLVTKLNVTGKCRMVVQLSNGWVTTTYLDETIENGESWKISNATFNQGWIVKIKLYFLQSETSYTLNVWGE